MGRRANSKTKEKRLKSELQEEWLKIAVDRYLTEKDTGNGIGARKICQEVSEECFEVTGKRVTLSKSTVMRRAKGGRSIRDFNAEKRWLSEAEEQIVADFAIDTAKRGFPLSHRRLREHVNEVCKGKLGEKFPEKGIGEQWTHRFLERHATRLRPYWSHGLDHSRARAVNPVTKKVYFDLLEKVINGDEENIPIEPDCIYEMDETGLQEGVGVAERVIGAAGQKVQYQQGSGERENITVLVTICADGTSIPPAVIFKGEAYQTSWKQDNPLDAS